jgi:glycosidase
VRVAFLLLLVACRARPPKAPVAPPPMPGEGEEQWWNDRIFYEVFVRSFQDSDGDGIGDLAGLIERLDYLNDGDPDGGDDLGVTGLWLMPVTASPSYHGYDVVDYYAIEPDYGDEAAFRRLIDEAHRRGMVVIVDLVINHTSNQHPWFQDARTGPQAPLRDWYVWSNEKPTYRGPWGQQVWYQRGDAHYYAIFWEGMPDLNYRNPEVTAAIYDATRFWLDEIGVDGFRMDAIRHLIEDGPVQENTPETHAWLEGWYDHYKGIDPYALTVGEVWTRSEEVAPYVGDELDICFEFDLATAILGGAKGGSSGIVDSVAQKVERLYPPGQYATFLTNHDQERAMTQLGGNVEKARLAAAIYMTLPGVPFVYYGEEIGMTGRKPDENLRTPMQWSGDAGAGFTKGTPWHRINADYEMRNVEAQLVDPDSLLQHYRRLIGLRSAYSALRDGALVPLLSSERQVYAYIRHSAEGDMLIVHNLGQEPISDYGLTLRASGLGPGTYRVYDLIGEQAGEDLPVGDRGEFEDYAPLATLAPAESYVMLLW